MMDTLLMDLRYAIRQMLRRPGATIVAVVTLALGIGANASMFAFVSMMLFAPAPATDPGRLVWFTATSGRAGEPRDLSAQEYRAYRDHADVAFTGVAAYAGVRVGLGGRAGRTAWGHAVSGNFFDLLGTRASVGRTFLPDEEGPTSRPVVVLSDALWRSSFGADPHIGDSTITINGRPFAVIGVAPPGFGGLVFGENAQLWIPLGMWAELAPQGERRLQDDAGHLSVVARLKPDVTIDQANAALAVLTRQLRPVETLPDSEPATVATPVLGALRPEERRQAVPLMALFLTVPALVLLVACANVGNLRLARALARRKEIAVRRAHGATRGRLVRQLLTESVLLAVVAGAVGIVFSYWLTGLIVQFGALPQNLAEALRPDGRVLAATIALAMLAGVVFGLAPALAATRPSLVPALKDEDVVFAAGGRRHRLRDAFVVGQVAVSLVLLVVAGLFLRSMGKALAVDPGFNSRNGFFLSVDPTLRGYTGAARESFERRLLEAARGLPGVSSAALTNWLPLTNGMPTATVLPGLPVGRATISARYFATMEVPLLRGRDFAEGEMGSSAPVVIVNETLAHRLWPGADPIGRWLQIQGRGDPPRQVVGLARDGKYLSPTEAPRAFLYIPEPRSPSPSPITLVVRATTDLPATAAALRRVVEQLDPDLPTGVGSLATLIRYRVEKQRSLSSMLGVFGAIALLVAALGIYGVTAHGVSLRTREIGIRMSLGARARDVLALFVREGVSLSLVGVMVGLALSAVASRVLGSFLFGIGAIDPAAFVTAAGILCVVAALASYLPARRAARVDPMVALRHE